MHKIPTLCSISFWKVVSFGKEEFPPVSGFWSSWRAARGALPCCSAPVGHPQPNSLLGNHPNLNCSQWPIKSQQALLQQGCSSRAQEQPPSSTGHASISDLAALSFFLKQLFFFKARQHSCISPLQSYRTDEFPWNPPKSPSKLFWRLHISKSVSCLSHKLFLKNLTNVFHIISSCLSDSVKDSSRSSTGLYHQHQYFQRPSEWAQSRRTQRMNLTSRFSAWFLLR